MAERAGWRVKVEAVDDYTVRFRMSSPYADLPVMLANTCAKIGPAAIVSAGLARLDREAILLPEPLHRRNPGLD